MALILAVDDSEAMCSVVETILTHAGHEVVTACDGQEGYDRAKERQFDLILADVNMPKLTGMRMVEMIRELENYQGVPILMVTTEDSDERKSKAKRVGASGWITKPIDNERLLKAVQKVLG